ncbi:MAG TPA: hypothetical protein VFW78_03795 [Bacteroidia bacterium]|nr:hypothetical protein [Bacteroidia bacterium]
MKKILLGLSIALLGGGAMWLSSCSSEEDQISNPSQRIDIGSSNSGVSCVQLTAGQNINSGNVCFDDIDTNGDNVDDAVQVCYTTIDGWELTEAHFFIGTSSSQIPMTKSGNPIPGQFPYNSGDITGQTSYCFTIPFSAIGFNCPGPTMYVIAAHAAVRKSDGNGGYQTQTGWGAGTRITTKGNWGTYFNIWITCTPNPPTETCTETAFAKGSNSICFEDLQTLIGQPNGNGFRWGWSNGPITTPGTYTMTLWAGAGLCNTNNGTNVGTLTVVYTGTSATVTYNVVAPYMLTETHLYVGCTELYYDCNGSNCGYTLAPGQFPYTADHGTPGVSTYTYTVNNLSCPNGIYVVAHASVKGFVCEQGQI